MTQLYSLQQILDQLQQPAFFAENGAVIAANTAALQRQVEIGMPIVPQIHAGLEAYEKFRSGTLYLTLSVAGTCYQCSVTDWEGYQLCKLTEPAASLDLQCLAQAAKQLRIPLSDLSLLFRQGQEKDEPAQEQITHLLYKLQRIVSNMADAASSYQTPPRLDGCDLLWVIREVLEKAQSLLSSAGIDLRYQLPADMPYAWADAEQIRRALYNLICNASRFSASGEPIHVAVKQVGPLVRITVKNKLSPAQMQTGASLFNRYARQPGIEDPQHGLGLGMTLVHAAAAAHGGTVLAETFKNGAVKITMTLRLLPPPDDTVRTPVLLPDVYGGKDQALVELSDVLPSSLYRNTI